MQSRPASISRPRSSRGGTGDHQTNHVGAIDHRAVGAHDVNPLLVTVDGQTAAEIDVVVAVETRIVQVGGGILDLAEHRDLLSLARDQQLVAILEDQIRLMTRRPTGSAPRIWVNSD